MCSLLFVNSETRSQVEVGTPWDTGPSPLLQVSSDMRDHAESLNFLRTNNHLQACDTADPYQTIGAEHMDRRPREPQAG